MNFLDIPEEIIEFILFNLKISKIKNCRCVCKTFKSIIDNNLSKMKFDTLNLNSENIYQNYKKIYNYLKKGYRFIYVNNTIHELINLAVHVNQSGTKNYWIICYGGLIIYLSTGQPNRIFAKKLNNNSEPNSIKNLNFIVKSKFKHISKPLKLMNTFV